MSQLAIPRLGARATLFGEAPLTKYSTTFPATETPISEGGRWRRLSPQNTAVNTSSGHAYGTSGANEASYLDDSMAMLVAVPPRPNMRATATMFMGSGLSGFMEAELHLRFDDNAVWGARGYEVFLSWSGSYLSIARWDGLVGSGGSWQYAVICEFGAVTAPANGDSYSAQIIGNTLTVSLAGSVVGSIDVTSPPKCDLYNGTSLISTSFDGISYASGYAGIGFDMGSGGAHGTESNYGFSSFTAEAL